MVPDINPNDFLSHPWLRIRVFGRREFCNFTKVDTKTSIIQMEPNTLTLNRMDLPIIIIWMSPLSFYRASGVILYLTFLAHLSLKVSL